MDLDLGLGLEFEVNYLLINEKKDKKGKGRLLGPLTVQDGPTWAILIYKKAVQLGPTVTTT